jgi:hypothetical protein
LWCGLINSKRLQQQSCHVLRKMYRKNALKHISEWHPPRTCSGMQYWHLAGSSNPMTHKAPHIGSSNPMTHKAPHIGSSNPMTHKAPHIGMSVASKLLLTTWQ